MKVTLISTSTFPADQGLRTLSACLKREGHEVKMIFLALPERDYSEIYKDSVLKQVDKFVEGSGLIGITAMSSTSTRAKQVIERYQDKIPVVWGGPAPTFFPEKCFESCNIIAVGEAEEALLELARKIEAKENITDLKNLYVRKRWTRVQKPRKIPSSQLR